MDAIADDLPLGIPTACEARRDGAYRVGLEIGATPAGPSDVVEPDGIVAFGRRRVFVVCPLHWNVKVPAGKPLSVYLRHPLALLPLAKSTGVPSAPRRAPLMTPLTASATAASI
jgi:hypothetical protein